MLYIYLVAHMLYIYLVAHMLYMYLDLHREPVPRRVYRQLIIVVSQEMGREPEDGFTHTNRSVPGSAQRTCAPPCLPPAHHRSQPENGA